MSMASGLPTAPFGRAAHHGTPCDDEACEGGACAHAGTPSSMPIAAAAPAAPVAPAAALMKSRRLITDSAPAFLEFFMVYLPQTLDICISSFMSYFCGTMGPK